MNTKNLDNIHYQLLSTILDVLKRDFAKKDNKHLCLTFIERAIIKKFQNFSDEEFAYICTGNMDVEGKNIMILSANLEMLDLTKYILLRSEKNEKLKYLPHVNFEGDTSLISILENNPSFCQKILYSNFYDDYFESKIGVYDSLEK